MEVKIVKAEYNDKPKTEYDYKHLDIEFEDGSKQRFHYHVNNPMPKEEDIIGLTWEELCGLCRKLFYAVLGRDENGRCRKV